jgi:hypothetical protein
MGTWTVPAAVTVAPVSVSPFTGFGGASTSQTFTLVYTDTAGASDITTAWVWFDKNNSNVNSCMAYYANLPSNRLYLLNDAGTAFLGPVLLGSSNTLSNSQCSINAAGSSETASGSNLTLSLAVTFIANFTGTPIDMHLEGNAGESNPVWQQLPVAPQLTSISPNSAVVNSAAVTLTVNGANFDAEPTIQWTSPSGVVTILTTVNVITYATQLQVTIPSNLLTAPGTAQVAVINPGNQASNSLPFTIAH